MATRSRHVDGWKVRLVECTGAMLFIVGATALSWALIATLIAESQAVLVSGPGVLVLSLGLRLMMRPKEPLGAFAEAFAKALSRPTKSGTADIRHGTLAHRERSRSNE